MFANFIVCCRNEMFIKCLIFIKCVDFVVSSIGISTINDL